MTETTRPLSPREAAILALIAAGRTNREIARSTLVEYKTVKNRIRRIYAKLGIASRPEAVSWWEAHAS